MRCADLGTRRQTKPREVLADLSHSATLLISFKDSYSRRSHDRSVASLRKPYAFLRDNDYRMRCAGLLAQELSTSLRLKLRANKRVLCDYILYSAAMRWSPLGITWAL